MFLLDLRSKEPIYEQIRKQIISFIEAGIMKPGEKLPSVRQLAQENGINPNTVARAYKQLEDEGFLNNIPKKGVYVAEGEVVSKKTDTTLTVLKTLKNDGVTKEELLKLIDELYEGDEL